MRPEVRYLTYADSHPSSRALPFNALTAFTSRLQVGFAGLRASACASARAFFLTFSSSALHMSQPVRRGQRSWQEPFCGAVEASSSSGLRGPPRVRARFRFDRPPLVHFTYHSQSVGATIHGRNPSVVQLRRLPLASSTGLRTSARASVSPARL
jgi:hypothetical protein